MELSAYDVRDLARKSKEEFKAKKKKPRGVAIR